VAWAALSIPGSFAAAELSRSAGSAAQAQPRDIDLNAPDPKTSFEIQHPIGRTDSQHREKRNERLLGDISPTATLDICMI
jgi:hypothetical protein